MSIDNLECIKKHLLAKWQSSVNNQNRNIKAQELTSTK